MKGGAFVIFAILVAGFAATVTAANDGGSDERFGYITVRDMTITLEKDDAWIDMNYTIDDGTHLIVLLLGKNDLKNKISKMLNLPDAQFRSIETDSAEIFVPGFAYDYGRGIHWFPEHRFNVMIPVLRVISPQVSRDYTMTNRFPNGIGYFDP
ncbi:MAG: hypothetical protein LUQ25_01300 [Methanoregulaceae archaeon]|nr:hypothetical protein [Methanoregulaceae archaeon]